MKNNCTVDSERYCKKCFKRLNPVDQIYSSIFQGYLCLPCYHKQFPKVPVQPKALLLVGYNHLSKDNREF